MVIYLDTSALVKLVRREQASEELVIWLGARSGAALVASALAEVELMRAMRRHSPESLATVPGVLARLYLFEIDAVVRTTAAVFPEAQLRTLDAVHLATATLAGSVDDSVTFVAYDRRLLTAADALGLPIASPGWESAAAG